MGMIVSDVVFKRLTVDVQNEVNGLSVYDRMIRGYFLSEAGENQLSLEAKRQINSSPKSKSPALVESAMVNPALTNVTSGAKTAGQQVRERLRGEYQQHAKIHMSLGLDEDTWVENEVAMIIAAEEKPTKFSGLRGFDNNATGNLLSEA